MTDGFKTLVERLKAAAHPLRLRVLALLGSGEFCVCQVVEALQVPQSTVSEALRELRRAGFVAERRAGRWVYVSLAREAQPLLTALLAEAEALPEAARDRARGEDLRRQGEAEVCGRVMDGARRAIEEERDHD